jgi:hypothetical protein
MPEAPLPIEDEKENQMAVTIEEGNLQVALTGMANGFAASSNLRTQRADQIGADAMAMWSINMTTPSVTSAHGMRVAGESGAGRTRAETNLPAATSAAGNEK